MIPLVIEHLQFYLFANFGCKIVRRLVRHAPSYQELKTPTNLRQFPYTPCGADRAILSSLEPHDSGMMIIEEIVRERLSAAPGYAAATIERIASTQRLTHLGVAAHVTGAEYHA